MCHTFSEALQNGAASALYKYEHFNSQEEEKNWILWLQFL